MGVLELLTQAAGRGENELFEVLFNDNPKKLNKLQMTTEIEPSQVIEFATLRVAADRWGLKVPTNFAYHIYGLNVAKDRKGRLELVESIHATQVQRLEEE